MHLKKLLVCILLVALFAGVGVSGVSARDTRFEIIPYVGYQWGGTLRGYEADARLTDAANWGIAVNIPIRYNVDLTISYTRQYTNLEIKHYSPPSTEQLFNMANEYYQIGALNYFGQGDKAKPYLLMTLGATRMAPDDSFYSSQWFFSFCLGLGTKIYLSERVGLRLQARMLVPMMWSGGGLWCGGGGCSVGISGGSSFVQGDVTAGLVVAF